MVKNLTWLRVSMMLLFLSISVWATLQTQRKEPPLTLGQILTGLVTEGDFPGTRTPEERNKTLIDLVRKRGVAFTLTEDRKKDLVAAKASIELIEAILKYSPPLPKPTPTPTPKPTPPPQLAPADSTLPRIYIEDLGNGVKLTMVAIPGTGEKAFQMGNALAGVHPVTIKPFFMGETEITQKQWRAVMGNNPSKFKGDNLPVESVSWEDAKEFCRKLSQLTNKAYRLPSEAEWEYACCAGTTGEYRGMFDDMAWYGNNSGRTIIDASAIWNSAAKTNIGNYNRQLAANGNQPHPVGKKRPNTFGLYDTLGNVSEWCEDVNNYHYKGAPNDGSAWTSGDNPNSRVYRGGYWGSSNISDCRARNGWISTSGLDTFGFRIAVSAQPK